jgi:hypothetical protein
MPELIKVNVAVAADFFTKEKASLVEQLKEAQWVAGVNQYLKQFNWAFVHPYLVGYNIKSLERMQSENSGTKEAVFAIFTDYFFDLRHTAYFIDGYYKERPPLKPFCHLIDQSVILCLQRDYAGGINLLISVIEGSLRHYLVHYHSKEQSKIMRTKDLMQAFELMKKTDYDRKLEYFNRKYHHFQNTPYSFDTNQVKALAGYHRDYMETWFSIIEDFFNHNLYLDTRTGSVEDKLNRHSIVHGFSSDIYYSLENYLRLFNAIHFLSWVFSMVCPDAKYLPDLDEKEVKYKWKAFEKVKLASDLIAPCKKAITGTDEDIEPPSSSLVKQLSGLKRKNLEEQLKYIDRVIDSAYNE